MPKLDQDGMTTLLQDFERVQSGAKKSGFALFPVMAVCATLSKSSSFTGLDLSTVLIDISNFLTPRLLSTDGVLDINRGLLPIMSRRQAGSP